MTARKDSRHNLKLRVKICAFADIGPGKIDLLEAVGRCGSITAAAKDQGMSYRRAWLLIDEMNQAFRKPVVGTMTGGAAGGGTDLTDIGRQVIEIYRDIQRLAESAVKAPLRQLEKLVKTNRTAKTVKADTKCKACKGTG